jgi:hypothetical protein
MKKLNFFILTSFVLAFYGSIYAQDDPGFENLMHSWRFEDFTADDAIGIADGVVHGAGIIGGGAFQASDTGQYIILPADIIQINTYSEISLEVWFTPSAGKNTNFHMLCYFGNSVGGVGSDGYFIQPARLQDSCRTAISCGNETNPWTSETGVQTAEIDDDQMHHIVSTLNATEIGMYVDGISIGTATLGGTNSIANLSNNFAWLCKGGYTADPSWQGKIHEFNIYNKVLTASEALFQFLRGPATVTSVSDNISSPFLLSQNFPNPFNLTTQISYSVSRTSNVKLCVYNVMGQEVASLVNKTMNPGGYTVTFNGQDFSSGIYFYQLQVDDQIITKRMMLTR